ncbi:MAG TPA: GntR family transcriptional regulator [Streptosporangiaceae bacterium]|jgi:GntR family transcriptional regulator
MATPLYRRIVDDVRQQIQARVLAPDAKLPSEQELQRRYRMSRNTVRQAMDVLGRLGLVEKRPGKGTFVTGRPTPFITTLSADPESGLGGGEGQAYREAVSARGGTPVAGDPQVEVQQARETVARALGLAAGAQVVSRHQLRYVDRQPHSMQTTFYPMSLVDQGADRLLSSATIWPGTVDYLANRLSIRQAGYRDTIMARVPDPNETAFFRLPADGSISVLETNRTAYGQDGVPYRFTVSVFPAHRHRLVISTHQVPPADEAVLTMPVESDPPGGSHA